MMLPAHDRVGVWAPPHTGSPGGPAPPLLLLHGIGGGRGLWLDGVAGARGVAPLLAAHGHDVAAVDLPGYGESWSVAGLEPRDAGGMARLVALLIDSWGRGPATVVGHSLGGMVALELWAQRPDVVAGLVLACSSAAFGKPDGAWQAGFVDERLAPLDAGLGMAGLARQLVPSMVAAAAPDTVVAAATGVMQAVPEATYRTVLRAIVSFDRRAILPSISVPTLCIAGDADRTAPPHVMRGVANRIPGAEYAELAHAGHLAPFEQPEAFAAAVHAFAARHRG